MKYQGHPLLNNELINAVYPKNDPIFWRCYFAQWERQLEIANNKLLAMAPVPDTSDLTWEESLDVKIPYTGQVDIVLKLNEGIDQIYETLTYQEFWANSIGDKFLEEPDSQIDMIITEASKLCNQWFYAFNEWYYDDYGVLPDEKTFGYKFIEFLDTLPTNKKYKTQLANEHSN